MSADITITLTPAQITVVESAIWETLDRRPEGSAPLLCGALDVISEAGIQARLAEKIAAGR